jgi:hypothetical protein
MDSHPDWYNSQMVTHSKGPKMCWLYVQSNDQATLEDERNSKQKQDPSSHPKLQHNHTFGCPVYALQDQLQGGRAMPKCNKWAWLGINLGPSPWYASSVNLVLKLDARLVLLQFHVQFNDSFETVRPSASNECTFLQWQFISGLVNRWTKDRGQDPQGATMQDETGQTILPSQLQPDELNTGQQYWYQMSLMQLSLQQMTQKALTYLTQQMNHLICIHQAICQVSVIMDEFEDLHNKCKRVMSNKVLHFWHTMKWCMKMISYFRMRCWTQLPSWPRAIRIQCTSTKQWKHSHHQRSQQSHQK